VRTRHHDINGGRSCSVGVVLISVFVHRYFVLCTLFLLGQHVDGGLESLAGVAGLSRILCSFLQLVGRETTTEAEAIRAPSSGFSPFTPKRM
jgi:hypothetical protein